MPSDRDDKGEFSKFVKKKAKAPYGLRPDGSAKGLGFFGALQRPDGRVSTELSIGIEMDGKEMQIPALVPTLSDGEKEYLINDFRPGKDPIPRSILIKARDHAIRRIGLGVSPFKDDGGVENVAKPKKPK